MNLLPEEEKNNIKRQYMSRLYPLAVYFLAGSFVLSAAAVFPYYVSGKSELARVISQKDSLVGIETGEESRKSFADFSEFSNRISTLEEEVENDRFNPSNILIRVLDRKPENVSITNFSYTLQEGDEVIRRIMISGEAGDRDGLLLFTENLSAEEGFGSVDLPVSNFSKRTDIDFSISIVLENKKNEGGE